MKAFITRDSSSSDESLLPPSFIAGELIFTSCKTDVIDYFQKQNLITKM